MKRYQVIMIAALLTALLSACSGKSGEPATEKSKENTQETVQQETRSPVIQILDETETAQVPETTSPAVIQAAGTAGAGENETGVSTDTLAGNRTETKGETKAVKETEPEKVYSVEAFETTMYATSAVNVRANYTNQSTVLTSLSPGQKVKVTGMSANGWMRIIYDGKDAFVYQKYLSDSAPGQSTAGPIPTESPSSVTKQPENSSAGTTLSPGSPMDSPSAPSGNVTIVEPAPGGYSSGNTGNANSSGPGGTSQGPGVSGAQTGNWSSGTPVGGPGM